MAARWRGIRVALEWIAANDEPLCLDVDEVAEAVTVLLIADCTGNDPRALAESIVRLRRSWEGGASCA